MSWSALERGSSWCEVWQFFNLNRYSYHTRQQQRAAGRHSASNQTLPSSSTCWGRQALSEFQLLQVSDFSTDFQSSTSPFSLISVPFNDLLPGQWGFSILWLPEQSMKKSGITLQWGWTKIGIAVIAPKVFLKILFLNLTVDRNQISISELYWKMRWTLKLSIITWQYTYTLKLLKITYFSEYATLYTQFLDFHFYDLLEELTQERDVSEVRRINQRWCSFAQTRFLPAYTAKHSANLKYPSDPTIFYALILK